MNCIIPISILKNVADAAFQSYCNRISVQEALIPNGTNRCYKPPCIEIKTRDGREKVFHSKDHFQKRNLRG